MNLRALSNARERLIASELVYEECLSRAIFELRDSGISLREIARLAGVPKSTVARRLHDDTLHLDLGPVDADEYRAAREAAWRGFETPERDHSAN